MAAHDDEILRALSHAERRRLLVLCRDTPRSAGELAADSHMTGASVSEHLKVLRKTGLARVDKQGKFWFYRTNTEFLKQVLASLEAELMEIPEDAP